MINLRAVFVVVVVVVVPQTAYTQVYVNTKRDIRRVVSGSVLLYGRQ